MSVTVRLPKQKEAILVPKELKPNEKLVSVPNPLASSEKPIKTEDLSKETN